MLIETDKEDTVRLMQGCLMYMLVDVFCAWQILRF